MTPGTQIRCSDNLEERDGVGDGREVQEGGGMCIRMAASAVTLQLLFFLITDTDLVGK